MTGARLNENNLLKRLQRLEALYTRAGFYEEAKFGFSKMSVTNISPLATFAMYRELATYDQLTRAVREFVGGVSAFQSGSIQTPTPVQKHDDIREKDIKLLVRPDARVQNMEAKIRDIADQLSNLTLILKKSHAKRPDDRVPQGSEGINGFEKGCSYCKMPGHGVNKCPENPNRERRCTNCGKGLWTQNLLHQTSKSTYSTRL